MRKVRYVSLFSGIEAASVAAPKGWEAVAFAEIDPFASAVLAERFPDVPNLGDVCKIDWKEFIDGHGAIDVICGGSPCQSFSIAGGRESLDGESRLMFEYIRAVQEVRPRWFVWENVPGVLNTRDDAFGCFIDQMDEIGYSTAWRVLDAQFFGVAQRRRRVWAVGASRDAFGDTAGGRAAAVLFERESVSGNTCTSKQKRAELAAAARGGAGASYTLKIRHSGSDLPEGVQAGVGPLIQDDVSATLQTNNDQTLFCIQGGGSTSLNVNGEGFKDDGSCYTLNCTDVHGVATLAFDESNITSRHNASNPEWGDPIHTLSTDSRNTVCISDNSLNPLDCQAKRIYSIDGPSPALCAGGANIMPTICMATAQGNSEICEDMSPTITAAAGMSGNNRPTICMATAQANAEILDDQSPTLLANTPERPIICVGNDTANAPIDEDISGTLLSASCSRSFIAAEISGCLCADDYKGINNQYVADGKVVIEHG